MTSPLVHAVPRLFVAALLCAWITLLNAPTNTPLDSTFAESTQVSGSAQVISQAQSPLRTVYGPKIRRRAFTLTAQTADDTDSAAAYLLHAERRSNCASHAAQRIHMASRQHGATPLGAIRRGYRSCRDPSRAPPQLVAISV